MARYIPYVCVCYQPEQQPFVRSPRLLYDFDNQSSMYIIFIDFHLILLKRIQVEFSQIEIEM